MNDLFIDSPEIHVNVLSWPQKGLKYDNLVIYVLAWKLKSNEYAYPLDLLCSVQILTKGAHKSLW